jgi:hypothetical protein
VGLVRFNRSVEAGVSINALWQARDDRGADIPPALRGARDRVFGLGPEAAVRIPAIRAQLRARYVWDLDVVSRPKGALLVVGLNVLALRPTPRAGGLTKP